MKSFTEIKKTADKYTWELYLYSRNGIPTENEKHKFLNTIRKVEKLQTNAVKFEGGSWLYWPAASYVKIDKYLYNDTDLVVTINEPNCNVLGYQLRPVSTN